ncbi:MAG: aldehyde dehydrogenase family protein [Deltaproteobacteria bacterium]|nr:MAG: aldehyde dehydrogenase family protein [Deltaproteobacteria bacterium]
MPSFPTIDPFRGEVLATYPIETAARIQEKIERLRGALPAWRALPVTERVRRVTQALEYFSRNRRMVAHDITRQMGKPIRESEREIETFFERAAYLCAIAPEALAAESLPEKPGFFREIRHEPLGVLLVLAAWNYPLLVAINGVAAALLSGNTVLLEHSDITPGIGVHFERAFQEAFDRPILLQTTTDHPTIDRIIEERGVDGVLFTGSVAGGKTVYEAASRALIACNLELGGKDGAYVAEDADPVAAAESLVEGAVYNAGQSCCSIERVYVHTDLYERFVAAARASMTTFRMGDPLSEATTLGPLARGKAAAERLMGQIEEALAAGARLEHGGKIRTIGHGVFLEPTLLTGVTQEMRVMQEESFGPLLPVMRVPDDETAFRRIDDSPYGLTAAIYTRDPQRADRFSRAVTVGTVFMNRCDVLDPALPWSGCKESGVGCALSRYGFLSVTRRMAIHFRIPTGPIDPRTGREKR